VGRPVIKPLIGIDLGGTKIESIAMSDAGEIVHRHRLPTPRDDYDGTLEAIAGLVWEMERIAGEVDVIGIGTPGAISPATGLIKNANSTWLNGRPFAGDLERRLGKPIRIANDANCFALSEAMDGAARGAGIVFGVILGTGVGGGVVVGGGIVIGANAIAGEWGHNPLPGAKGDELPGPPCYCGRNGCIETYLSGPGMSADHEVACGERYTPEEILAAATAGSPSAEATLQRYENRLARALSSVINLLDPDVIVLGGGLSNIERLYESVPATWSRYIFSDRVDTRLVRPVHGDSSGVRGAAWLTRGFR